MKILGEKFGYFLFCFSLQTFLSDRVNSGLFIIIVRFIFLLLFIVCQRERAGESMAASRFPLPSFSFAQKAARSSRLIALLTRRSRRRCRCHCRHAFLSESLRILLLLQLITVLLFLFLAHCTWKLNLRIFLGISWNIIFANLHSSRGKRNKQSWVKWWARRQSGDSAVNRIAGRRTTAPAKRQQQRLRQRQRQRQQSGEVVRLSSWRSKVGLVDPSCDLFWFFLFWNCFFFFKR